MPMFRLFSDSSKILVIKELPTYNFIIKIVSYLFSLKRDSLKRFWWPSNDFGE